MGLDDVPGMPSLNPLNMERQLCMRNGFRYVKVEKNEKRQAEEED